MLGECSGAAAGHRSMAQRDVRLLRSGRASAPVLRVGPVLGTHLGSSTFDVAVTEGIIEEEKPRPVGRRTYCCLFNPSHIQVDRPPSEGSTASERTLKVKVLDFVQCGGLLSTLRAVLQARSSTDQSPRSVPCIQPAPREILLITLDGATHLANDRPDAPRLGLLRPQ